jgi:hypothetical protein
MSTTAIPAIELVDMHANRQRDSAGIVVVPAERVGNGDAAVDGHLPPGIPKVAGTANSRPDDRLENRVDTEITWEPMYYI